MLSLTAFQGQIHTLLQAAEVTGRKAGVSLLSLGQGTGGLWDPVFVPLLSANNLQGNRLVLISVLPMLSPGSGYQKLCAKLPGQVFVVFPW